MLWQEPYSLSSCTPLYTIRTRPSSRHVARYGSLGGSNSYYQNIYKAHIPLYNIYECIRAPHYEVLFSLITKVYHAKLLENVYGLCPTTENIRRHWRKRVFVVFGRWVQSPQPKPEFRRHYLPKLKYLNPFLHNLILPVLQLPSRKLQFLPDLDMLRTMLLTFSTRNTLRGTACILPECRAL